MAGDTVGPEPWVPTPEILVKIENLAARGLILEQIAMSIGIARSTLCAKKAGDFPEIQEAIDRGKAKGVATVTNALFEKAKKGDNTAMIFFLKNRDPENWMDVQKHHHGGHDGGPIMVTRTVINPPNKNES